MQVGEDDWAADQDLVQSGAWGEALRFTHSPDGSVMLEVEETLARVVGMQSGHGMNARLHGLGDGMVVRRSVNVLPARVLFGGHQGGTGLL